MDKVNSPQLRQRKDTSPSGQTATLTRTVSKNAFQPRKSRFDSGGELREQSELRGFFNLITVMLVFFFVTTQTKKLLIEGTLVGLQSGWELLVRFDLFPAWLFMVGSSFIVVFFQKLVLLNFLPRIIVSVLRVLVQIVWLGANLAIGLIQQFPVVQSSFFLAELLVIMMKMHSYIMTNREYHKEYLKIKSNQKSSELTKNQQNQQTKTTTTTTTTVTHTPTSTSTSTVTTTTDVAPTGVTENLISYPENVTLYNYLMFLLFPTLVYELNYPRSPQIRWGYFFEKFLTFIGLWAVMHVLVVSYILPILAMSPQMTHLEAITHLIIPMTGFYLLIFYMVFDVACNGFAEITRFGDREFYSDWWNSKTWDEFARKWNKPVHEFLLRHVYLETINTYKMSKLNATFATFLVSSLAHEFFMSYVLRLLRPWLFVLQMCQLPLIFISRHPTLKNHRFGNHFFWFGLCLGVPLLSILYGREYWMVRQAHSGQLF